jgi:hypothetical protein
MEKLLRDHYANYVVQTALEHGDVDTKNRLWDLIIPLIQNLRSTPCGRRLVQKLQQRDQDEGTSAGGQFTPESATTPAATPHRQLSNQAYNTYSPSQAATYGASPYNSQIASPQPHRLSNTSQQLQASVSHPYSPYNGRGLAQGQTNGQSYASPGHMNGQSYSSPQQVNGQSYGSPNGQSFGSPQQIGQAQGSFF